MTYRRIYKLMYGLYIGKYHSKSIRGKYKFIKVSRRAAPKMGLKWDDIGEFGARRLIRKWINWRFL